MSKVLKALRDLENAIDNMSNEELVSLLKKAEVTDRIAKQYAMLEKFVLQSKDVIEKNEQKG